jgi:hypothetical protein
MPSNGTTTITLSQVPQWVLLLSRGGVVQSSTDGHYTLAGSTITLNEACDGTERIVVDYASTSYTPVPPINGSGISDGTITTAQLADRSVTNIKLASDTARANLLTNGSLAIAQRGSGPFTANSVLVCDRWQMSMGAGSTYSCSANQPLGSASPAGGSVIGITGSYTHANNSYLAQTLKFNDMGAHLRLTQVAYSMRVFANAANAVRLRISGDGTGISPATSSFHPGNSTWQTLTVISNVIPADANSVIAQIEFAASVSSWSACMGMLVPGSVAADYAPLHPADDLARCLRYYEKIGPSVNYPQIHGYVPGAGNLVGQSFPFAAKKFAAPTITFNGTFSYTNGTAGSLNSFGPGPDGCYLQFAGAAAGGADVYSNNSGYITAESNP